jgi:hypothetical protein
VATALRATGLLLEQPGRKPLVLTLLRADPDASTALLNEETGDLLVFREQPREDRVALSSPWMNLVLTLPEGKKPGKISIEGGPELPVKAPTTPPGTAASGAPRGAVSFMDPDGTEVPLSPAELPLLAPTVPRAGRPEVLYKGRWLPAVTRGLKPQKMVLGARALEDERLSAGRGPGCLVHGVAPTMGGALEPVIRQAWQGWVRERCEESGKEAVIELGYSTVRLMGVAGLPCHHEVVNGGPMGEICTEPPSGVHVPINLQARVSNEAGIVRVEEAFLLDTRAGTMTRLTPLATEKMGEVVRWWATTELAVPSWFPRKSLTWPLASPPGGPAGSTLTVGPSTIDLVLPVAPFGLFLPSRHVAMGPRSLFVTAFVPGEGTRRLTAALHVAF